MSQQITKKINGEKETKRQFVYIEKAREYVKKLETQLGHKPTCCVTTFGCHV